MHIDYDSHTAAHYAAYRPQLHLPILEKCLGKNKNYDKGLDVGCGVGHSSLALAHFCNRVVGVEPSIEMLGKALSHPKVRYQSSITGHKDYSSDFFDVITFAGSLYYAKSQALLNKICRAGKAGCTVVVYDFEIMLDDLLLEIKSEAGGAYDHQVDFSGLKADTLSLLTKNVDQTPISIKPSELAHLILSVKGFRLDLKSRYPNENLLPLLMNLLSDFSRQGAFVFDAKVYYTIYRLDK